MVASTRILPSYFEQRIASNPNVCFISTAQSTRDDVA
jgi:hypothetical protein